MRRLAIFAALCVTALAFTFVAARDYRRHLYDANNAALDAAFDRVIADYRR
jgi:hypothetical protein